MALRIFLMDATYSCKEHFAISLQKKLDLPNNWKRVCRRVCLNWDGKDGNQSKNDNANIMMECLKHLFDVYKARNGFDQTYENDEDGIEKMIFALDKKNISVITVVYENTILYGDLLCNTTSISTRESEFTDKMEAIQDEVMKMLDNEVEIDYLRPNREWLQQLEEKRLKYACEMAYMKLKAMLLDTNTNSS